MHPRLHSAPDIKVWAVPCLRSFYLNDLRREVLSPLSPAPATPTSPALWETSEFTLRTKGGNALKFLPAEHRQMFRERGPPRQRLPFQHHFCTLSQSNDLPPVATRGLLFMFDFLNPAKAATKA